MATRVLRPFSDLAGQIALVTGASGGIGRHMATTLASQGCNVVVAARRGDRLKEWVDARHKDTPGKHLAVSLDVKSVDNIHGVFQAIALEYGGDCPSIVVNNAGVAKTRPSLLHRESDWDSVMDTNLKGPFFVAKEATRRLIKAKKQGSIINIASVLGSRASLGVPSYSASKAGLIHLTSVLAAEWARYGVRVNAISPGFIESEMTRGYFDDENSLGHKMKMQLPQQRVGKPDELDGVLLYLASTSSSAYTTGSNMHVDGGYMCIPAGL